MNKDTQSASAWTITESEETTATTAAAATTTTTTTNISRQDEWDQEQEDPNHICDSNIPNRNLPLQLQLSHNDLDDLPTATTTTTTSLPFAVPLSPPVSEAAMKNVVLMTASPEIATVQSPPPPPPSSASSVSPRFAGSQRLNELKYKKRLAESIQRTRSYSPKPTLQKKSLSSHLQLEMQEQPQQQPVKRIEEGDQSSKQQQQQQQQGEQSRPQHVNNQCEQQEQQLAIQVQINPTVQDESQIKQEHQPAMDSTTNTNSTTLTTTTTITTATEQPIRDTQQPQQFKHYKTLVKGENLSTTSNQTIRSSTSTTGTPETSHASNESSSKFWTTNTVQDQFNDDDTNSDDHVVATGALRNKVQAPENLRPSLILAQPIDDEGLQTVARFRIQDTIQKTARGQRPSNRFLRGLANRPRKCPNYWFILLCVCLIVILGFLFAME